MQDLKPNTNGHTALEYLYKLYGFLLKDKNDFIVFGIYTVFIGLLYLSVPLTAQVMFNIISTGILIQPLIILTLVFFLGLVLLSILRFLQIYITEILQRKIFARMTLRIAEALPRAKDFVYSKDYGPELANRFFDTINIQKSLSQILLEVPAASLQIVFGLILIGVYSPYLLFFDLLFLGSIVILVLLGVNGLSTSIKESSSKYKVAYWLEEIARCQLSIKMNGLPKFIFDQTIDKIEDYVEYRKQHFSILIRQFVASFAIEAFASVGVLLIGGWLVINQGLTLGQLVAAELVILMIISALDKIIQKVGSYYDLLTGIAKVGTITDLDQESTVGALAIKSEQGAKIECSNLVFAYNSEVTIFNGLDLKLNPGERVTLVGYSGSGKSTLAYLICGLYEPIQGKIFFNQQSINSIDLINLREQIALVSDFFEIFSGTVRENIGFSKPNLSDEELDRAIKMACLEDDIKIFPKGLDTELISEGKNISLGQRQRIMIARAILKKPQLLILDEVFGGMDEKTKMKIFQNLNKSENNWTILNITHDVEIVYNSQKIIVLDEARIIEEGTLMELVLKEDSRFQKLFPELSNLIKRRG